MAQSRIIGRGAEAIIYSKEDAIIKKRQKKNYRIKEIDEELRSLRTRKEARIIRKLSALGFSTAKVLSEDYEKNSFKMEFLKGKKLRDVLSKNNYKDFCKQIGKLVAFLHSHNIIHNDLTTSNMIVVNGKIYFIDFGLSFYSTRIEDMAVDLHLLRQALESKHQEIWKNAFSEMIKAYKKNYKDAASVLKRFEVVEMRGRYKKKGDRAKK